MDSRPWENEPDEFALEASGLPVRGRRGGLGAWCGYVGVPPTHPLHGHGWSDPVPCPPGAMERPFDIDEHGVVSVFLAAASSREWGEGYIGIDMLLAVHGGLTFAGYWQDEREVWYFGFDCAHAGDLVPQLHDHMVARSFLPEPSVYRTIDFVKGECLHLAEQLAAYPQAFGPTQEQPTDRGETHRKS